MRPFFIISCIALTSAALLTCHQTVTAEPTPSVTAHDYLLAPQVHVGQTLAWRVDEHHGTGQFVATYACTVTAVNAHGFSYDASVALNHLTAHSLGGPFTSRDGVLSRPDGTPATETSACFIYQPQVFGTPPADISVGTQWSFASADGFDSDILPELRGTVSVASIDPTSKRVVLDVTFEGGGSDGNQGSGNIRMTLGDGGVIIASDRRMKSSAAIEGTTLDVRQHYVVTLTGGF